MAAGETTAVRGYDCLGLRDDDSADLVIKVYADAPQSAEEAQAAAERAQMCLPYEVQFHF